MTEINTENNMENNMENNTEINQVYRCTFCGNMVEVVRAGREQLFCCNRPMGLVTENTVGASKEKHIPVIERTGDKVTVKVGSAEHPMEEKHYIEWIEVIDDHITYRQFLKPGEKPQAEFKVKSDNIFARAYCNLHGLWLAEE